MKKVFAFLAAMVGICIGAFAQESRILDDWNEQIEARENDIISSFSYANFTYNNYLGAPAGLNRSGWGIEISALHIGFNPWTNGRFTLGLFDMAFDFGYLTYGNNFAVVNKQVEINSLLVPDSNKSNLTNFSYMFPIGYIQRFGDTQWSAAFMASPGVCWDRYRNKYVLDNVRHEDDLRTDRGGNYFRLDLKAMIWYDNIGIVGRYTFARGFQGPGFVSVGISFRI